MYGKFTEQYPTCALKFLYNHIKQPDSRKENAPFWDGRAVCRTGNCVSAKLIIDHINDRQPTDQEDVVVHVTVRGKCTHVRTADELEFNVDMPNRRQLSGMQHHKTGDVINTSATSATEMHFSKLGQLQKDEVAAGNVTVCQTPSILSQVAYERRMSERLHPNAVLELDIARKCWQSSVVGPTIPGYIQQLGLQPFHVVFYSEQQVRTYVDACKAGDAVIHCDATGSVMSSLPGQKRLLYYCFLLCNGSLPVVDILTTRHSGDWLHRLLLMFNSSVRRLTRGRVVMPKQVVTDFSYALMSAFNGDMTIEALYTLM